jgi:hypothetical protein
MIAIQFALTTRIFKKKLSNIPDARRRNENELQTMQEDSLEAATKSNIYYTAVSSAESQNTTRRKRQKLS